MAVRPGIPDRVPIDHVEVEYERASGPRKPMKPGFNRVRLLSIGREQCELATREGFPDGEKLNLVMHVKGVHDFLKVEGSVGKCVRINVLRQPAYGVELAFPKLTEEQARKVGWMEEQLMPKTRGPIRREEPSTVEAAQEASPAATPAVAVAAPPDEPAVKRPVALLQLIEALDKFEVTDDLIQTIIEAGEAGLDVEALFQDGIDAEDESEEGQEAAQEEAPAVETGARPMQVYRLTSNTKLHFAESGLPVGPAVELLYVSRLKSAENCFAVTLETDAMTQQGSPSFQRGSILVFSIAEKVENGDFAYVRSRGNDAFAQVFTEKDEVRIRALNPEVPERVLRRMEVRALHRLVGQYVDMASRL